MWKYEQKQEKKIQQKKKKKYHGLSKHGMVKMLEIDHRNNL